MKRIFGFLNIAVVLMGLAIEEAPCPQVVAPIEDWKILDIPTVERRTTPPTNFNSDGSIVTLHDQRLLKVDALEKETGIWREDISVSEVLIPGDGIVSQSSPIFFTVQKFKDGEIEYLYIKDPNTQEQNIIAVIDYKGFVRFQPQYVPTFEYSREKAAIRIRLRKIKL